MRAPSALCHLPLALVLFVSTTAFTSFFSRDLQVWEYQEYQPDRSGAITVTGWSDVEVSSGRIVIGTDTKLQLYEATLEAEPTELDLGETIRSVHAGQGCAIVTFATKEIRCVELDTGMTIWSHALETDGNVVPSLDHRSALFADKSGIRYVSDAIRVIPPVAAHSDVGFTGDGRHIVFATKSSVCFIPVEGDAEPVTVRLQRKRKAGAPPQFLGIRPVPDEDGVYVLTTEDIFEVRVSSKKWKKGKKLPPEIVPGSRFLADYERGWLIGSRHHLVRFDRRRKRFDVRPRPGTTGFIHLTKDGEHLLVRSRNLLRRIAWGSKDKDDLEPYRNRNPSNRLLDDDTICTVGKTFDLSTGKSKNTRRPFDYVVEAYQDSPGRFLLGRDGTDFVLWDRSSRRGMKLPRDTAPLMGKRIAKNRGNPHCFGQRVSLNGEFVLILEARDTDSIFDLHVVDVKKKRIRKVAESVIRASVGDDGSVLALREVLDEASGHGVDRLDVFGPDGEPRWQRVLPGDRTTVGRFSAGADFVFLADGVYSAEDGSLVQKWTDAGGAERLAPTVYPSSSSDRVIVRWKSGTRATLFEKNGSRVADLELGREDNFGGDPVQDFDHEAMTVLLRSGVLQRVVAE